MKKALSIILAVLMLTSSIALLAMPASAEQSDSVSLTLDEGLVLTVNDTEYKLVAKEMTKKNDGYSVKDYAEALFEELSKYKDLPLPAITVIPGSTGSSGYGLAAIKNAVERAVGADILFRDDE